MASITNINISDLRRLFNPESSHVWPRPATPGVLLDSRDAGAPEQQTSAVTSKFE